MSEYIVESWIGSGGAAHKCKEEIVRCRDCKYYIEDTDPIDPGWPMMCADSGRDMLEPYGFCAWGERRTE